MDSVTKDMQPKVFITFPSENPQFYFKKSEKGVFAESVSVHAGYPIDVSSFIPSLPTHICYSQKKVVKWLLNNQYIPLIKEGKIIFRSEKKELEDGNDSSKDSEIEALLGPRTWSKVNPNSQDVENNYYSLLLQAKREEQIQNQIFYLYRLSEIYVEKHNWQQAAKILNSACTICEKQLAKRSLLRYLFSRLEKIVSLFLESKGIQLKSEKNFIISYRSELENVRANHKEQFYNVGDLLPIQRILQSLTKSYKEILSNLISDSQDILGGPPTDWACVGMGSMSREEMCPYSDLEFAFIIKEKTEHNLTYFRILSQLIELKIINLGETRFPIFAPLFGEKDLKASPTPGGFSMDSGGNTPLGKPGFYELIDTPEGLAKYQSPEWLKADIIVSNALSSVCHIAGNQELTQEYNRAKKERHLIGRQSSFSSIWVSNRTVSFHKNLALKLLEGHLQEFRPDLSEEKQATLAFGIKKELYRPIQCLLGSLKLFYDLDTVSTFDTIVALYERILSPQGAENLSQALAQVLRLRFEAHFFYQNEEEILLHVEEEKSQDTCYLYLTKERLEPLQEIYKVLIPFHNCSLEFLSKNNPKIFKNTLYNDSPLVQGEIFLKTLQYEKAREAFQQAVSLDPSNIEAWLQLGFMERKMGNYHEALEKANKALKIAEEKFGEKHAFVAKSCNDIGLAYNHLAGSKKSFEFHNKALQIRLELFGELHLDVAESYHNLARAYTTCDIFISKKEALETGLQLYQKAFAIRLKELGEKHADVAQTMNNIGLVSFKLKNFNESLQLHQKVLKIRINELGENHPDVAQSYSNIALNYFKLNEPHKALQMFQKALSIELLILNENHPIVASSYNNMGVIYQYISEYSHALKFHQKAMHIRLSMLGSTHPDTKTSYQHVKNIQASIDEALEDKTKKELEKLILDENQKMLDEMQQELDNVLSFISSSSDGFLGPGFTFEDCGCTNDDDEKKRSCIIQ